jgi:hypothetical protein
VERTPGDDRTIESPSVFGRTYHDARTHARSKREAFSYDDSASNKTKRDVDE